MAVTTRTEDADLTIAPVKPFDFQESLAFLGGFVPCAGDHHCSNRTLATGGYADGKPFAARISEGKGGMLAVDVDWLDDPGDLQEVGSFLGAFLSLDDELTGLYAAAERDPAFGKVVDDLYGYHHVRFSTPFEAACWAALSQRTSMSVGKRLKRALVEAYGRVELIDGTEISLFPTPEMVRDGTLAVGEVVDHDRKARTLIGAAEAFANEDLAALDDETLRERLEDVWGFGEWSSEFVSLRGFGRLSGTPRTERRLREAVAALYGLEIDAASDADLDRLSAPYEPLEGYWAHYIRVWVFRRSLES